MNSQEKRIKIQQDAEKPIERAVLEAHIIEISKSMNKLLESGLNRKAVIVLIADSTKQGKREIEYVLNSLEQLSEDYCTRR